MLTFILILISIISIIINIGAIIIIKRLLLKNEIYEDWILNFKKEVSSTLEEMRLIDKQGTFATSMNQEGTFESDDQVGHIFKDILSLIEQLNSKIE